MQHNELDPPSNAWFLNIPFLPKYFVVCVTERVFVLPQDDVLCPPTDLPRPRPVRQAGRRGQERPASLPADRRLPAGARHAGPTAVRACHL